MKIRMLVTMPASPDGINILSYEVGEVYAVGAGLSQALADSMLEHGQAEEVSDKQKDVATPEVDAEEGKDYVQALVEEVNMPNKQEAQHEALEPIQPSERELEQREEEEKEQQKSSRASRDKDSKKK